MIRSKQTTLGKKMKDFLLLFILGSVLLFSCSKDEDNEPALPNYIGEFTVQTLRDECSDPNLNGSVAREQFGVCLFQADGSQNCIDITIILNEDMTYEFTSQITEIAGGFTNSRSPSRDMGIYEVNGVVLTLDPDRAMQTTMTLSSDGRSIDWLAATLDNDCDRIYGLERN